MPTQPESPSASQRRIILRDVRLSYPHLFEPRAAAEGADPKYSTTVLIPKDRKDLIETIQAAIKAAITDSIPNRWGGKKPSGLRMPLRDGDSKNELGEYERAGAEFRDHFFLNASSKTRPGVVSGPNRDPATHEDVWPGEFALVSATFFGYSAAGNKGVSCALNNVWLMGRGDRLDGGISAEDEFAGMDAEFADAEDELLSDIA